MKSNQKNVIKENFTIFDDNPADYDDYGIHTRIAMLLKKLITSNKGGKTISLDGEWGAGKSTVIKLLEKELYSLDKNSFCIFSYDTWIHSSDPLRKAFLIEIIDKLVDHNWVKNESKETNKFGKWDILKSKILGKIKVQKIESEPNITQELKILIPILVALPICSSLFVSLVEGYLKDQYFFIHWHNSILVLTILFGIVVFGPALYLAYALSNVDKAKKILSMFINKTVTDVTTTNILEPEATTIEFQEIFKEILDAALSTNKSRKLVIVLDNLDRLSNDEEVEEVLKLLRGFIDSPSLKSVKWIDQLWVVIPLHIKKLSIRGRRNCHLNYLEKIFQIRIELPPPLMSSWKTKLNRLLEDTFGLAYQAEYPLISRLYDNYTELNKSIAPTPRELILFVNNLVLLKLQWESQFRLSYYAAYFLLSKLSTDFVRDLQNNELPIKAFERILDTDITRELAALYFNIQDIEEANQILLKPKILEKLQKSDANELSEIINRHDSTKHIVIKLMDEKLLSWATDNPKLFFSSIETTIKCQNFIDAAYWQELIRIVSVSLKQALETLPAFPIKDSKAVDVCLSVLNFSKDTLLVAAIIRSIISLKDIIEHSESYPSRSDKRLIWIDNLKKIFAQPELNCELKKLQNNAIQLNITANAWEELCNTLENYEDLSRIFSIQDHKNQLKNYFKNHTFSLNYDESKKAVLNREVKSHELHYYNDELMDGIVGGLSSSAPSPNACTLLMDILKLSHQEIELTQIIQKLKDNGVLHNAYFDILNRQITFEPRMKIALALLKTKDMYSAGRNFSNSGNGSAEFKRLVTNTPASEHMKFFRDLVIETDSYGVIVNTLINYPETANFLRPICKEFELKYFFKYLTLENFEQEITAIANKTAETDRNKAEKDCLEYLIKNKDLIKNIISNSIKPTALTICKLVVLQSSDKKLEAYCLTILKQQDKNAWIGILADDTAVQFLIRLANSGKRASFGSPFKEALTHMIIKNTSQISIYHPILKSLILRNDFNEIGDALKKHYSDKGQSVPYEVQKTFDIKS